MSGIGQIISKFMSFITSIFSPPKSTQQQEPKKEPHVTSQPKEEKTRSLDEKVELPEEIIVQTEDEVLIDTEPEYDSTYLEEQERLTMEDLLEYLTEMESYTIHYNVGERGKTAPTGIYYKYFADWEGWAFLTQVAQEHEIEFDPSASDSVGCKELTDRVCENYKGELDNQIYEFTQKEYFNTLNLDSFPGKKSALSYFSITVNGGKYRSAKILQRVLSENGFSLKIDGQAGRKTYQALEECGLDDPYLNQQILLKVYDFYNYLLGRNPDKYTVFYDGWINRLKKLGFVVPS